jgi:hypothetical protein
LRAGILNAIVSSVDQQAWVRVEGLPDGALHFAATLGGSSSPTVVPVRGSVSVVVAARTLALSITEGPLTLGTIHAPEVGYIYTFDAT